jgi:hypothetical protein
MGCGECISISERKYGTIATFVMKLTAVLPVFQRLFGVLSANTSFRENREAM